MESLFERYLDICNRAIAQNKDNFPYQQILSVSKNVFEKHPIDLAVYDDRPKIVLSLQFQDDKLKYADKVPADPKKAWRVNLSYLRQVVKNPQEYISHPEKLDLDWLKSRLGL